MNGKLTFVMQYIIASTIFYLHYIPLGVALFYIIHMTVYYDYYLFYRMVRLYSTELPLEIALTWLTGLLRNMAWTYSSVQRYEVVHYTICDVMELKIFDSLHT